MYLNLGLFLLEVIRDSDSELDRDGINFFITNFFQTQRNIDLQQMKIELMRIQVYMYLGMYMYYVSHNNP